MDGEISVAVEGRCGVITLTRPEAINALTPGMIGAVLDALHDWADEDRIGAVLIEGAGEKGLCAGGDVRLVREMILAGAHEEAAAFFAEEYEMNGFIAGYAKPVVALQHGIVMGGGIGISSHGRYRVATTASRFAMPEGAIGFFCDVGVNALLYKTTEARALAFLLSGQSVGAADAIALGLADTAVAPEAMASIRARVVEAAQAADPDTAIAAILQGESADPGPAQFCALADALADVFSRASVGEIVEGLRDLAEDGDPGAAALHASIVRQCSTSLVATLLAHRLARRQRDTGKILAADRALSRFMAFRPDFAEGVRAVLVDKDRDPKWRPSRAAAVDVEEIAAVLGL